MPGNSWICRNLAEELVWDWQDLNIYSEFDMQVATYHHLRKHFDRRRSPRWIIRTQPALKLASGRIVKPDVVIYDGKKPVDALELKCMLGGYDDRPLHRDAEKLRELIDSGIRHTYIVVLYDDEYASFRKPEWGKRRLTFLAGNVRRHPNGRRRARYDEDRRAWERHRRYVAEL